ncbi:MULTISPECIES: hypothetical protein [unclassified Caulobacter]|uniref:hypothetical protein n=1 Tax=unclassified Caulobacter TaxID=2648921 RepID=UPI0012E339FF|nr:MULTISPECIES: hypothetical protein [unclassified Caulobacter]
MSSPVERSVTGEGDREAVEGASEGQGVGRTPPPSRCVFASRHLPRFTGEE